jgi:D-arabinose 1-dehydrogenase-like Zn-dependent alcohol dehydrogenase
MADVWDGPLSHSDVHSIYGETPMETDIAGHEGVGHVVKCRCKPLADPDMS